MPSQPERERKKAGRRGGGQGEELGREGGQKGLEAPGRCLGSVRGGERDLSQGGTGVGEFLIRMRRDGGRRGGRGVQ